jgi:hypothetical protein
VLFNTQSLSIVGQRSRYQSTNLENFEQNVTDYNEISVFFPQNRLEGLLKPVRAGLFKKWEPLGGQLKRFGSRCACRHVSDPLNAP